MNISLASLLVLALLIDGARAEDTLMQGGRAPDGRYEVRIARDPSRDPSDYAVRIHTAKDAAPLYTLDSIGGYLRYPVAVERCRALWHSSGDFVVVTDQGTRHSREVYILAMSPDRVERLPIPDFVQNALGRVNATEIDLHCVSTPVRWDGDDLLLTHYFSVSTPEQGRIFYTCDVVLNLSHDANTAPTVGLKRLSTPKPGNG